MESKKCPSCFYENAAANKFCLKCGFSFKEAAPLSDGIPPIASKAAPEIQLEDFLAVFVRPREIIPKFLKSKFIYITLIIIALGVVFEFGQQFINIKTNGMEELEKFFLKTPELNQYKRFLTSGMLFIPFLLFLPFGIIFTLASWLVFQLIQHIICKILSSGGRAAVSADAAAVSGMTEDPGAVKYGGLKGNGTYVQLLDKSGIYYIPGFTIQASGFIISALLLALFSFLNLPENFITIAANAVIIILALTAFVYKVYFKYIVVKYVYSLSRKRTVWSLLIYYCFWFAAFFLLFAALIIIFFAVSRSMTENFILGNF